MKRLIASCILMGATILMPSIGSAETYPSRLITLVVPFAAGSGTDNVARILSPHLEAALGQSIIIENRAGATGTIASGHVARSAPDGYTLLMGGTSTHAASKALLKSVPYDPVKDFVAVAKIGVYPFPFLVPASVPANTLAEFIAYAKANPGKLAYAYGNAPGRVAVEALKKNTGIDLAAVSYRASPAAMTDLVAGRVSMLVVDYTVAIGHLQSGSVKALSVTSKERSVLLKDVPGMQEQGFPWLDLEAYTAFFAPAGTPDAIIQLLRKEIKNALAKPELIERLATIGFEVSRRDDPARFPSELEQDIATWKKHAEDAGITPQ